MIKCSFMVVVIMKNNNKPYRFCPGALKQLIRIIRIIIVGMGIGSADVANCHLACKNATAATRKKILTEKK